MLVRFPILLSVSGFTQTLPVNWEEMTAADFQQAIQKSQGACLLPFGIIEKHGPHLPLGNDVINVRYAALHGAEKEFAVVFPAYYFGQIFEARHEPGTLVDMNAWINNIATAIRAIKSDQMSPETSGAGPRPARHF